eukprot:6643206-Pyramimonas_sp.AAC.1
MRPRRPWGLRTAELSSPSWAPGGPAASRLTRIRMRPGRHWGLRAASCETVPDSIGSCDIS